MIFLEEVKYVASLSNKYLAEEKEQKANCGIEVTSTLVALVYTAGLDLLPLLMATGNRIDRLPILYLREANA